jgi:hypothetical protein
MTGDAPAITSVLVAATLIALYVRFGGLPETNPLTMGLFVLASGAILSTALLALLLFVGWLVGSDAVAQGGAYFLALAFALGTFGLFLGGYGALVTVVKAARTAGHPPLAGVWRSASVAPAGGVAVGLGWALTLYVLTLVLGAPPTTLP